MGYFLSWDTIFTWKRQSICEIQLFHVKYHSMCILDFTWFLVCVLSVRFISWHFFLPSSIIKRLILTFLIQQYFIDYMVYIVISFFTFFYLESANLQSSRCPSVHLLSISFRYFISIYLFIICKYSFIIHCLNETHLQDYRILLLCVLVATSTRLCPLGNTKIN